MVVKRKLAAYGPRRPCDDGKCDGSENAFHSVSDAESWATEGDERMHQYGKGSGGRFAL